MTDASGTYNAAAFTASDNVTGVSGGPTASLEGVTPSLSYYAGASVSGTALSGAPTTAGTSPRRVRYETDRSSSSSSGAATVSP